MPFIWDDFEWKLVDDEDLYDKDRFVVARKLLVKSAQLNAANEVVSVESIRRHFRKFGEIESIEMLRNSLSEAHVTFVSDRVACFVQSHYELDKKMGKVQPYEVEPAYTWEQPLESVNPKPEEMDVDDEQTSEIFNLNEDCLLHLFKFLDLKSLVNMAFVCKMFNQLLRQHCFPSIRDYDVSCHPKLSLAQMRRELLCIGRHITDLFFRSHYKDEETGKMVEMSTTSKFLKVITKNVGQNIRRASVYFGCKESIHIMTIAPILQNLEFLYFDDMSEIHNHNYDYNDIDFPALCPNLIKFTGNIYIPKSICCKPWPSLFSLSFEENPKLKPETLMSIIEQNPQLTSLEFGVFNSNYRALFTAIAKCLTDLETLTIHLPESYRNNFVEDFSHLGELLFLDKFELGSMGVDSLKGVIDHLSHFESLHEIQLWTKPAHLEVGNYDQSLVNLAKQLPYLGELLLVHIQMKEETLIDIVRYGRHLNLFGVFWCKIVLSDALIVKLVDVLKCYRRKFKGVLELRFKGDFDKLNAEKTMKFKRYLRLETFSD